MLINQNSDLGSNQQNLLQSHSQNFTLIANRTVLQQTPLRSGNQTSLKSPKLKNIKTNRRKHSLESITTRFIKILQQSQNSCVNLNQAANQLSIQKRRIYDIVNILEGIGYLTKISVNIVKLVGCKKSQTKQIQDLKFQLQKAKNQEQQLNFRILELSQKFSSTNNRLQNNLSLQRGLSKQQTCRDNTRLYEYKKFQQKECNVLSFEELVEISQETLGFKCNQDEFDCFIFGDEQCHKYSLQGYFS